MLGAFPLLLVPTCSAAGTFLCKPWVFSKQYKSTAYLCEMRAFKKASAVETVLGHDIITTCQAAGQAGAGRDSSGSGWVCRGLGPFRLRVVLALGLLVRFLDFPPTCPRVIMSLCQQQHYGRHDFRTFTSPQRRQLRRGQAVTWQRHRLVAFPRDVFAAVGSSTSNDTLPLARRHGSRSPELFLSLKRPHGTRLLLIRSSIWPSVIQADSPASKQIN